MEFLLYFQEIMTRNKSLHLGQRSKVALIQRIRHFGTLSLIGKSKFILINHLKCVPRHDHRQL